jgi:hypothetical protein
MSDEPQATAVAGDLQTELDTCRQQVEELKKALMEMAYFITMTCAALHLNLPSCDCDERIKRVNAMIYG